MTLLSVLRPLRGVAACLQRHARGHGEASAWLGWIALLTWTSAWVVAGRLEQDAYRPRRDHISGLAAVNAQHPNLMIVGFVLTGVLILALTAYVWRARPGNGWALVGTALLLVVGIGFVAAGLLRSDCADAVRACAIRDASGASSWHSQAHNLIASSLFVYALVPTLFALALRDVRHARWLCAYSLATAALGVLLLAAFQFDWLVEWEGTVQRAAVSIPLVWTAVICSRIGHLKVGPTAVRLRNRAIAQFRPDRDEAGAPRMFYFSGDGVWSARSPWVRPWVAGVTRCVGPRSPPEWAAAGVQIALT